MYVAVKGGERAIENAHALLADARRGDRSVPEISLDQISEQLALAVDRVMSEGSLYDRELAALAIKQARGDLIEAIFLVRAFRTTCPRFGAGEPLATAGMDVRRRISAIFKDLPGGQVLGPTFDYTHRLLDPGLADEANVAEPPAAAHDGAPVRPVTDLLERDDLIERSPKSADDREVGDLTRDPLTFPAGRDLRLQNLARGDEGFLLALGYSTQRGYGRTHPFAGEIRYGEVEVEFFAEEVGFAVPLAPDRPDRMSDDQPVQGLGSRAAPLHARLRSRLRAKRTQGHVYGARRSCLARARARRRAARAGAGRGIRPVAFGQRAGDRLCRALEAAALRRLPGGARVGAADA
jgi:alpha-D-ribose 1-methylphosphonate 5-triphosphate synthase subunit PhnI